MCCFKKTFQYHSERDDKLNKTASFPLTHFLCLHSSYLERNTKLCFTQAKCLLLISCFTRTRGSTPARSPANIHNMNE